MTKCLPYTIGKKARASLILLVIANMALLSAPHARATSPTTISVDPSEYTAPAPGHNFTVNVTITNVTSLAAFEFKLGYNTTLLDAVEVYIPPTIEELFTNWLGPDIMDADGYVYFGSGSPVDLDYPFTGSGALLTINFTATALGSDTLYIYYTSFTGIGPAPDYTMWDIDHDCVDGSVTVVPEFPASIVMPLLLIITLAATFLGKMAWSRKRKNISSLE